MARWDGNSLASRSVYVSPGKLSKVRHWHHTNCADWTFMAGSAMLGFSIAINAVSVHGTCTAVFVATAAVLGFMFSSIRTLGKISWLAWVGLTSLITASRYNMAFDPTLSLTTHSLGCHDRGRRARPPRICTTGRPLDIKL